MRLINADALKEKAFFHEIDNASYVEEEDIDNAPTVDAVEVVRCKDCRYFDLDHFENFRGIPLIVAHEICNRWGNGCKTDSNGFCFMGERRSE